MNETAQHAEKRARVRLIRLRPNRAHRWRSKIRIDMTAGPLSTTVPEVSTTVPELLSNSIRKHDAISTVKNYHPNMNWTAESSAL